MAIPANTPTDPKANAVKPNKIPVVIKTSEPAQYLNFSQPFKSGLFLFVIRSAKSSNNPIFIHKFTIPLQKPPNASAVPLAVHKAMLETSVKNEKNAIKFCKAVPKAPNQDSE